MAKTALKETITIKVNEPTYYLDEDVTYAQRDAWFGHVTRDLRMDIIYPQTDKNIYPCIVWICGGGWRQVDKGAHMPYLADLARRGFVVASLDYRLSHEAPFPGALIDLKEGIRWLRAHAKRYSIDTTKFGVMGESAGGYLAAMVALAQDKSFEQGENLKFSSAVQAACPWYMPCDMAQLFKERGMSLPFFNGDMKDPKYGKYINPISYISAKSPPFLIIHGTEDQTVPLQQGELMHEALVAKNLDSRMIILKGEGHAGPQFFQRPLWEMIISFFKKKLS
ncbi:MAG: alpha/beta hydrolase [Treponema sp.]|nr:alpha/beta hydrolase [Treponema sp.]